jgi:RNA polymerase sigma-70 factor, ECF subfamily
MDSENPNVESDEALVARAKRDLEAFGRLYDRYVTEVYHFVYQRVKNHTTAEEITAKVFHRALEQLARFEWRGVPFGAWLMRVAANLIHDHNGHAQRHISLQDWLDDGIGMVGADASVEDQCAARQTADMIWQAVAILPRVHQQVLVLRFAREMSIREIANAMGRSEGAVKQLLFRAMKRLHQGLQHIGFDNGS